MKLFKKLTRCFLALFLSSLILYADLLYSFPSEITMYSGEFHNTSLGAGVYIGKFSQSITSHNNAYGITPLDSGEYETTLKIGNTIPFKKVKIKVTSPRSIYASGSLIGLRIYNKGLIVTDISSVMSGRKSVSPSKDAGIVPGDIILEINGVEPSSLEDVGGLLKEHTTLTVQRNNSLKVLEITPAKDDSDGKLKLGAWVRDSTAGIGTLTFFDTENNVYGALGHSISDSDTGVIFNVKKGSVEKSSVVSVKKGTAGSPGEICGSFDNLGSFGNIQKNCECGIFGSLTNFRKLQGVLYPVGVMSQVKEGNATILSTVDGAIKEYEINILRSMPFGSTTKGMMIEVTDKELLSKTGGIVQGMSGSPIIQNGKLIGAVTHVLVNDPTRGYGIFIENMLSEVK